MKISEMVEQTADTATELADAVDESLTSMTKKRKAEEMTADDVTVPPAQLEPTETAVNLLDQLLKEQDGAQEPPARRRKTEKPTVPKAASSMAGDMAKYAAAAAVGGASTVAFLCSPLAEKLLEWLA